MNDETRETLWAYLDGALPDGEKAAIEARLAASESLRAELESLRAVSRAVKDTHPARPLPDGFLARLGARRDRGDRPRRDWVFLPHEVRPLVAAMSFGVVALLIWDKVVVPDQPQPVFPMGAARVDVSSAAPVAQVDLSARALHGGDAGAGSADLGLGAPASERPERGEVLPLVPAPAAPARKALADKSGRAPGQPLDAAARAYSRATMTETERSARNEELIGALERQKKAMGITSVISGNDRFLQEGRASGPDAPRVHAQAPAMLKAARASRPAPSAGDDAAAAATAALPPGAGRPAPEAALVFTDARGLSAAWVLLGFTGRPPAGDFSKRRLVLLKPSGTKIVSAGADGDAVTVVYRALRDGETASPAKDRTAWIPREPGTVLILDATPR
jgi:anti-sigma factor RsiW